MALAVGDVIRTIFTCGQDGQQGLNIRYWRISAVAGAGLDEGEVANALFLDVFDAYCDLMTTHAEFLGVSVRDVTDPSGLAAVASTSDPEPGTVAGDPLPPQCCGLIKLRTKLAGRANRGRLYVPFPGETDSTVDHVPSDPYLVRLLVLSTYMTAQHTWGAAGDTVTGIPVIRHADATTTDINGANLRRGWATQRRRGFFGAGNPRQVAV